MLSSIESNLRYLFPFPVVWEEWIRGGEEGSGGEEELLKSFVIPTFRH
jgi:hypothetical protein